MMVDISDLKQFPLHPLYYEIIKDCTKMMNQFKRKKRYKSITCGPMSGRGGGSTWCVI